MELNSNNPYVVGLTGGIGSGKSTACSIFSELGIDIVDADTISHELVTPGSLAFNSQAFNSIVQHFGDKIQTPQGGLNRSLLRELIFTSEEEKLYLENLLHPLVREEIIKRLTAASSPYVILSAPLLLENEHYSFVNKVLVIDSPEDQQINRTIARDNVQAEAVKKIIASQLSRKERLEKADDVIVNNGNIADLKRKILELHNYYGQQSSHDS